MHAGCAPWKLHNQKKNIKNNPESDHLRISHNQIIFGKVSATGQRITQNIARTETMHSRNTKHSSIANGANRNNLNLVSVKSHRLNQSSDNQF